MDNAKPNESEIHEVLEIVHFLKDNAMPRQEAVSKVDLVSLETRLDHKLVGLETRSDHKMEAMEQRINTKLDTLTSHVDSFVTLHQKLEQELTALRGKYDRLEGALTKIAQRLELNLADLGL